MISLLDSLKPDPQSNGEVRMRGRELFCPNLFESPQKIQPAAVIGCGVTQRKDFDFHFCSSLLFAPT